MKKKPLPIGISDFKKLISNNYYYVDKTGLIRELIENTGDVILLPRPRRFGKTLNLDMLKVFFEKTEQNNRELFKGLAVEKEVCFDTHQGKYPVIFLTLKDLKHSNWEECVHNLKTIIYKEYKRHRYLMEDDGLFPEEKRYFDKILNGAGNITDYQNALQTLSEFLHRYHERPVVILVDEYDTPLHAGYNNGYYQEIIGFIRNFLSGGLKDNPCLYKGVLTGILRVAKESIFSGLNNLGVYTILMEEFNAYFGFTEIEVRNLLSDFDISDRYEEVSGWYNGYLFGGKTIYNPWSIISYVNSKSREPFPYWINTGDTSMIDRLATRGGKEIREEIGRLVEGKTIERPVYDTIVMQDLNLRDDLLWTFLLFSGYLKPAGKAVHRNLYPLAIPNAEVKLAYEEMVIRWFSEKIESNCLMDMLAALEIGDMALFERLLQKIVLQIMSVHDFSGEPEKVYHALVLGMLVWLSGKYEIRSNRESGYGRYDILLKPAPDNPNRTGIIIEFKLVDGKKNGAHETVLEDALKQIENRGYAAELNAAGISDILEIAVAFRGKQLWMKHLKRIM